MDSDKSGSANMAEEVLSIPELPHDYPAVLVVRKPGEQPGRFLIDIWELNGADPMATPSLLRVAAGIRQSQLEPR